MMTKTRHIKFYLRTVDKYCLIIGEILNLCLSRNGHASIQCNSFSAGFDPSGTSLKHGGNDGVGSYGCPDQFVGVGHMCFLFPVKEPAAYNEMAEGCGIGAVPYAPMSLVQNTVVKALAKVTVIK